MGIKGAPCYNCPDRKVDPDKGKICEENCAKWQEWVEERERIREEKKRYAENKHSVISNKSYRW